MYLLVDRLHSLVIGKFRKHNFPPPMPMPMLDWILYEVLESINDHGADVIFCPRSRSDAIYFQVAKNSMCCCCPCSHDDHAHVYGALPVVSSRGNERALTPSEKLERARIRNRDHSRKSRQRKKALVEGMKKQVRLKHSDAV